MNLIQNKEIYKILLELDNIGISEYKNGLLDMYTNEEEFEALEIAYGKYNNNNILTNFIENNKIYLSELEEKGYIKVIKANWEYLISFPILTDKGKIFLENYDSSKSKQLDTYLGKYPNISKLMYFIAGIITSTIVGIIIRLLTN